MRRQTTSIPELLEREPELEALSEAVARTREGAGRCVLIEAPAGVGKSRLLARVHRLARDAGLQVLDARGAALEREFAFGVARQLFEQPVNAASDRGRDALFAGAAELSKRLLGQEGTDAAPEGVDAAFGALHGLYWLTVNLADKGPLLLAVDDAHWADQPSLRFIGYLSRRLEGLPVLLVVAGRAPDPDGEPLWQELADDQAAEVLRPRALSEAAAGQVLRDGLDPDVDDELVAACHRATGGNPLFLRELVAALRDAQGSTRLAPADVTAVGPPAVGRFVLHRLERLGAPATELARSVAVLGSDSDLTLAARTARLEPGEARQVADLLVRADVLAPERRLGFVHPIVEAAIYEELLPGDRAARHLEVARLLDESGAPAERVATHLLRSTPAGEPWRVDALRAAAASAEQRGAPAAAVSFLRRALDELPPDDVRAELLCDLGRCEVRTQEPDVGHVHLLEALDTRGDATVHARAAIWLSRSALVWGRPDWADGALAAIDAQLGGADPELVLELEAEALTLTRLELSLRSLFDDRMSAFEQRAVGHPRYEPVARIFRASEEIIRGAPAVDVASAVEAALAAGPPTDPYPVGLAIDLLVRTERDDAAARWLDLTIEVARSRGLGPQLAGLYTQRAIVELGRGAVGEAQVDIQTALELAGQRHFLLPRIVAVWIEVALERGEIEPAAELVERHGDSLARDRVTVDDYLVSRGRLRIAEGDVRGGLADLLRCGELLESHRIVHSTDWRSDAAVALAELDDREQAERIAREGVAEARAFGAPRALARSLRAAGRAIGGDEGLELLEEAVSVADPSSARLEAAHALADLGAALVERRRRREGREALRLALELAQKCGATALADRVRGDLGAGGGRPPRLELSGVDALTPAERRVCDLAAGDLTNREIAQTLFVTEKTVELHLTNAYRKLGIRSRFQLASVLAE
jgi:DNA-binding CsgD family transcriptional regulator